MKNYLILLAAIIIFGSCSSEEAAPSALQMARGSSQALLFIKCKAVSQDELEFEFSDSVKVKSVNFYPALPVASVEDGSTVRVKLDCIPEPGIMLTADILAEDSRRNTINVIVPLRSRNNRMPVVQINELCVEATNPKTEFIELKMKSAGNLGAMRVVINGNTKAAAQTIYEFAPMEVKANDYLLLHLRKREDSYKDEVNGSKAESSGNNSSTDAWDFYVPGNSKLIHEAASAVYLLDQDDKVLDAVMISDTPKPWWEIEHLADTAGFLFMQNAWKTADGKICSPSDSLISIDATNTRTICRDETVKDSNTAADWYITADKSATPGSANNTKRYSKAGL